MICNDIAYVYIFYLLKISNNSKICKVKNSQNEVSQEINKSKVNAVAIHNSIRNFPKFE